ncbi:MAG: cobaltochelatase subunit CobT, partial [Alphaproteobacteria bacterium]|nr:cobaltochelatase subunit CobT [Alphaproteobacteria bacterium]
MTQEDKDRDRLSATAAALRALGRTKDAHPTAADLESRGKADARAVYLRHHDPRLGRTNAPMDLTVKACFEALERARCEALGFRNMKGVARNLHDALTERCAAYEEISSREDVATPEALYVLARLALTGEEIPPSAARLETLWAPLLEKLRESLSSLSLTDQAVFAEASQALLQQLGLMEGALGEPETFREEDNSPSDEPGTAEEKKTAPSPPPESETNESEAAKSHAESKEDSAGRPEESEERKRSGEAAADQNPEGGGRDESRFQAGRGEGYMIYTTRYDEIVRAEDLATAEELERLRATLDRKLAQFSGMITRLANRLQRKLMARQQRSWQFDLDEGVLDTARLSRFIANPTVSLVYKQESETPFRDTVVSLLIDNSGSMRGRPIAIAAMCADILARTLERC